MIDMNDPNTGYDANKNRDSEELKNMIRIVNRMDNEMPKGNGDLDLSKVKSLIVHWPAAPKQDWDVTINYLKQVGHSYNWLVGDGFVYETLTPPARAIHVGASVYKPEAIKKFGRYTPPWDHRNKPHNSSPNWVCLGMCIAHEDWDGTMTDGTYETAAAMAAYVFHKYLPHLDPLKDINTHTFVTEVPKKDCPKWFINNPDDFAKFKMKVKTYLDNFRENRYKLEGF